MKGMKEAEKKGGMWAKKEGGKEGAQKEEKTMERI